MDTRVDYKAQLKHQRTQSNLKKLQLAESTIVDLLVEIDRLSENVEHYKNQLDEALPLAGSLFEANQREDGYREEIEHLQGKLAHADQLIAEMQREFALLSEANLAEYSELKEHYTDLLGEYGILSHEVSQKEAERERLESSLFRADEGIVKLQYQLEEQEEHFASQKALLLSEHAQMEKTLALQIEANLAKHLKLKEHYAELLEEHEALFNIADQEKGAREALEHRFFLARQHIDELEYRLEEQAHEIQHLHEAASDQQEQKHYFQDRYERLKANQRELSPLSVADRRSLTPSPLLEITGECDDSTVFSGLTSHSGSAFFHEPRVERETVEVYARVVRDDDASSVALLDPIHCLATPLTPSEVAQFRTEEGLPVISPSGQPYALSCVAGVPKATLTQGALHDADHYTLAVTIINMIDNVLSKGDVVKVNTPDPFIAEIATLYIQHLKDNTNIITSSKVTCSTAVTQDVKQDALGQFQKRDIATALSGIEHAPWYAAAIERSEAYSSLAISA